MIFVNEVKSCAYNPDTGTIDVTYSDGREMSVLCNRIEDMLELSLVMRSKYDWLIFNEPNTFVELVLSGELLNYLEWYDNICKERERNMCAQLEKYYPPGTARGIARELMMYDS